MLVNHEGVADPADLVAAMVIWRAATPFLPLLPGLVTLTFWRRSQARTQLATPTIQAQPDDRPRPTLN